MGVSGTYAFMGENIGNNAFYTGLVDIELNEYILNENNEEILYTGQYNEQFENVTPNQDITLIERVSNVAEDCYLRAKMTLIDSNNKEYKLDIQGMPKEWEKIGEYYYYKPTLKKKEEVNVFEQLKMPPDIEEQIQDYYIVLHVVVEAIQANNFNPDYEAQEPWNNVKVEKSIHNDYAVVGNENSNKMTIKYENNTNNYIKVPNDFLESLSKMMPGDNRKLELRIENIDIKSAEFFLNVENEALTQEQENLLRRISLKITNSIGQVLYNGSLADVRNVNLGKYNKNNTEKLTFSISAPEDLSNEYSSLNPSLIWRFSAKYEEDVINKIINRISNPQTGDFKFDLSLILFFTATAGLIVVLALSRADSKNTSDK